MSLSVIYEAVVVGFKECFKAGIVWLIFSAYIVANGKRISIMPFYYGILCVFLISAASFFLPREFVNREYLSNFISTSFAVIFLASGAALFHASGANPEAKGGLGGIAVFLFTILFFSPDAVGSVLFLKELSLMKEAEVMTYVSALAGVFLAAGLALVIRKASNPAWLGSFFTLPQLLLFLAIVKLLSGGIKGIAEISLIPAVQRGFMKFSHDFIHQTLVILMVPDHLLLSTTVWDFIGIFFGPNLASIVSLLALLFFPFMFIYYSLLKPAPEPEAGRGPERRKIKYLLLSDRRRKALPVVFFVCIIVTTWFMQRGEPVTKLYNPKPKPVVEEQGAVMIPLDDPTMNLRDGALHKFALTHQGEEIRIMIIRKPDNALSVCLDACEICPPDGYGQSGEHVICIYCITPIPISALGEPGGCNPIPLSASVDSKFVRIELGEILKKWEYVKSGKSKEGIK